MPLKHKPFSLSQTFGVPMTKTVYVTNKDFLILKYIKVVSGTTENFAPDTKQVGKFAINTQCLAKVFTIIHKQIRKDWLFCCFS